MKLREYTPEIDFKDIEKGKLIDLVVYDEAKKTMNLSKEGLNVFLGYN